MALSRRTFLAGGATATAAAALGPHLGSGDVAGWSARPRLAWAAGRAGPMPAPSPEAHLLSRATFGPTAAELARVRAMGTDAWIEEQLDPASIDDREVEDAVAELASVGWSIADLRANPGRRPIRNELIAATLYRAANSRRQLYEVLVDHWSNVFNVFQPEEGIIVTKTLDDREVARKNALGSFRAMLHASAQSPAMLRYLNTVRNTRAGPNENYAREVMELHALGVDGGYTERDVKEVARCFTGWNTNQNTWLFEFREADHDPGPKTVLGKRIQSTGAAQGHEVLDMLVDHPSCARHVARRLACRFVADSPPEALVQQVAAAFGKDGDIRAMMGVLLRSDAFKQAVAGPGDAPAKIRRPLEYWVAALRATGVDTGFLLDVPPDVYEGDDTPGHVNYGERAERYLQLMDQIPFRWRPPNGYPDVGARWNSMHVVISRWNFGLALADGRLEGLAPDFWAQTAAAGVPTIAGAVVDHWARRILARDLLPADRQALIAFLWRGHSGHLPPDALRDRLPTLIALLLDSPYFQRR